MIRGDFPHLFRWSSKSDTTAGLEEVKVWTLRTVLLISAHTYRHIHAKTWKEKKKKKARFCLVCRFLIEIRAFKQTTELILIR